VLRCTLQAVHDAISRRIEWLDGNFLAAINAYVVAAERQGNPQLQRVLATIRSEVLQQVRCLPERQLLVPAPASC
jgi:hypothetical protein